MNAINDVNGEWASDDGRDIEALPEQVGTGALGKAMLAAGVGLLSAAFPPGAVAFAAMGAATQEIGESLNRIQKERTGELLWHAALKSALTPDEVVQRLLADDEHTLLAAEALDAARRTRVKEKTRALGESLGAIVADDAAIDPESIWVRILTSIERPHVRLLSLFLHGSTLKNGAKYWRPGSAITVREAGDKLGLADAVLPLIQDLVRCGLVISPGIDGGSAAEPELALDGLNQKMTATWLGPELFLRLKMEVSAP
jgi:hypothetical protein